MGRLGAKWRMGRLGARWRMDRLDSHMENRQTHTYDIYWNIFQDGPCKASPETCQFTLISSTTDLNAQHGHIENSRHHTLHACMPLTCHRLTHLMLNTASCIIQKYNKKVGRCNPHNPMHPHTHPNRQHLSSHLLWWFPDVILFWLDIYTGLQLTTT